jgi:DNA-binding TFAR19-related protein (PDSD5 family)
LLKICLFPAEEEEEEEEEEAAAHISLEIYLQKKCHERLHAVKLPRSALQSLREKFP